MPDTEVAWAAGLIDGEGCIFINKSKYVAASRQVTPTFRLVLKVTMGCRKTVERLRDIFGVGTVQNHVPRGERVNASYSWICQSAQARTVFELIKPHAVTKAAELDVALRFASLPLNERGGKGGSSPVNPELLNQREALYWELRKLKSRWRFFEERLLEAGVHVPS